MADWLRMWHGAPTDPKWRTIAKRARVRPGDVWAVASVLMDRASQAADRGSVSGYDCEVMADALGFDVEEVERIIAALTDKGVILDGRLASWNKYQPKREDASSDRVREYRKRVSERDETQCNASERNVTLDTEESREEKKEESASAASSCAPEVSDSPKMPGLTDMERRIARELHSAGVDPTSFPEIGHAALWQAQGFSQDICAAIVGEALRRGKRIRSLSWFDDRIREAHEKRAPAPTPATPEIPREIWEVRVSQHRTEPDRWPNGLGKPPDHPACKAPPDILAKHGFRSAA